jgi:hypothetical protein
MMDPKEEQQVCIKFSANLGKSATETLAMIGQVFGVENMIHIWAFEENAWFRPGKTFLEDNQHIGRSIGSAMPNTAAIF